MKNKIITALIILCSTITPIFALEEGLSTTLLPSGQRVVIKEVRDNNIVKIDTWINTGSINEDDKTAGISHFLEHLFFKGTQKYPTGTFDKILDSKGATVNAATSKDYTHYYIQIPSKDFDIALDLHADMLQNPMIPRKELERERPVVVEEISKTKDSPRTRMLDNFFNLVYEKSNHPYKRPIIGKKEVIESVTREEILDYFNKFYTPDAYTTVIVGDVNKDEAIAKVIKAFGADKKEKKKKQFKVSYPKVKPLDKIERVADSMDINNTHFLIGFFTPKFGTKEDYPLDVLSVMLTEGKSSILNRELKENKELVLSVDSGNYAQKDSGVFYVYATLEPQKEKYIENEILSELQKIKDGKFDDSAVIKAKNLIKTETYYSRESVSNIASDLGYDFTFSNDENYYENYLKNIDKVTKEDIVKVANKYLLSDKYGVSAVRPQNFKPVNDIQIDDKTTEFAPQSIEKYANAEKFKLSNGAVLITKQKKSNSIIAMDISIKGSKAIEKKPGVATLAAAAAMSGSSDFTNAQFSQFLDENGIKMAVTATSDNFSILIQSTKENLDKAFLALNEVLNKASFLDGEISKIKARKISEYKSVKDSPSSYVFDEFKKLAYPDTIYGQNSDFMMNAIKNVTRDDIIEFYSRIINPQNMVISVVGDVDNDQIIRKTEEIIKENKKGTPFEYKNYKYNKFIPDKNIEKAFYKNDVQANWLALGWKIPGILNRKDIAVLNVINSILGEGMSSRLFVDLREDKGLAYVVGSTVSANVFDGIFPAYIGTNPNGIEEAKKGILDEFERIRKEMVTNEELTAAKDKIIGKLLISMETNMDEANVLSKYCLLGRSLKALDEYKEIINNVSQSDIIEVANKYFSKPYIYALVGQKTK